MKTVSGLSARDALLLFAGALLLRLAGVSGTPASSSEAAVLAGLPSPDRTGATDSRAPDLTASLASALAPLAPPPPDPRPWKAPPGGPLGVRLAFVLLGALVAPALGAAGASLGGRAAGWIAGGLAAVSPFAYEASVRIDPAGALLAATAGSVWLLTRLAEAPTARRALGSGALVGLATAASSGAAGLALGWPVAARGYRWAVAIPMAILLFGVGAPGAFLDLVDPARPPGGPTAAGISGSPLVAGLATLGGAIGIAVLALAVLGVVAAVRGAGVGDRALLAATGGALLATLLAGAADATRLAVVVPGLFVFAGRALERPVPPRVRTVVVAAVLASSFLGTAPKIAARWVPSPEAKARTWVERNVPAGTPILVEGGVHLASREAERDLRQAVAAGEASADELARYGSSPRFQPLEIPARTASADEVPIFYDPNIAKLFEWILLEEQPQPPASTVPFRFRKWIAAQWDEVGRFDSIDPGIGGISAFRRPPGYRYDPESALDLIEVLGGPELVAVRDTSRAFTEWVLRGGTALRAAGEAFPAKGLLELATLRDSTDARARYELGLALLILERDEEAEAAFVAGLDADPFHGGIHYNLGTLLEKQGEVSGAEVEYLAAIAYLDDPSPAHARLGALLAARGDLEGAQAHLAELVARDPEGEAAQFLAEAIIAAGGAP